MTRNEERRGRKETTKGVGQLLLLIASAGLAAAGSATAGVYTSGCAAATVCTFQELLLGGTISAGGQRFASFQLEQDPGTIDWNQVVVAGQDATGFSPGPGLRFSHSGEAKAEDTECLDVQFSYTVTPVIPSWHAVGNDMNLASVSVGGTGRLEVDETLFSASRRAIGDKTIRSDDAFDETRLIDTIAFSPEGAGLIVSNTITIEGEAAGDLAELDAYVQRFALTQVPEPGFVSLIAGGVGLLAGFRRRNRRFLSRPRHNQTETDYTNHAHEFLRGGSTR